MSLSGNVGVKIQMQRSKTPAYQYSEQQLIIPQNPQSVTLALADMSARIFSSC